MTLVRGERRCSWSHSRVTAALAAACSGIAPASTPTQAPAGGASSQPKTGGTLRVGVLGDLLGLDGHLTTGLDSLRRVWDVVNILDDKLNTVPVLAESLDLSTDAAPDDHQAAQWHPVP